MPTIPIFAESYWFSRLISALRFRTSKLRHIDFDMVPDRIMGATSTSTPVIPVT